jgi:hypothetical protein
LNVDGHNKDILIDPSGNVVEVEEEVSLDSLPTNVQDAFEEAARTGTIMVVRIADEERTTGRLRSSCEARKKRSEVQVGPNGEKLKRPE